MAATLVDTHCHLDAQYFPEGPDDVLTRARASGVGGFVVIGVGSDLEPARADLRRGHTVDACGIRDQRGVDTVRSLGHGWWSRAAK